MAEKIVLGLVCELCEELNAQQVAYCHWKSNAALDRSASGDNDLDLLISREDIHKFTEILDRLGFIQVHDSSEEQTLPGVLDYYGYDQGTGRLVHVHVHYQLIFGHDFTKNYHIPIERPYLASAYQNGLFKVPSAEFELIVLVIRLMLKHSTWDTFLLRHTKLSASERNELDYLLQRASMPRVCEILKAHLPFIAPQLFETCLESLQSGSSVWRRVRVGQKLVGSLDAFARQSQIVDAGLKLWRRVAWSLRLHVFRKKDRKRMNSGGLLIAIVGGDGAGKTTAINELYRWLSGTFEVSRFHMGKPDWSVLTILVRGIIKVGRSLGFYPFEQAEIKYTHDKDALAFPGYPWMIRELCTARDRYITYKKARRLATNGGLVILDRFPLPQIQFMDGAQIDWLTINYPTNRLIKFLSNCEKRYYQEMLLPDIMIVLRADPEVAVVRKTEETETSVRARSTEIWEMNWDQTPAHVIDANRSKDEVLAAVKSLVWSQL